MEYLEVVDQLIKEATRINVTRKALKQIGFSDKDICEMVEHFVIEKITQPMEE